MSSSRNIELFTVKNVRKCSNSKKFTQIKISDGHKKCSSIFPCIIYTKYARLCCNNEKLIIIFNFNLMFEFLNYACGFVPCERGFHSCKHNNNKNAPKTIKTIKNNFPFICIETKSECIKNIYITIK